MGDNPNNWMFDQKSIRLKLNKSELENRRRYFEYKSSESVLPIYIAYKFAKELDLLVSEARLVELLRFSLKHFWLLTCRQMQIGLSLFLLMVEAWCHEIKKLTPRIERILLLYSKMQLTNYQLL